MSGRASVFVVVCSRARVCANFCTLHQTSGAAAGSDQDTAIPDGLALSELADVLVEAGAVNAINLVGGAPSALVVNGSVVVDPAEACWSGGDSDRSGERSVLGNKK